MNTSPITEWEGAEAVFTWASSPTMLWLCLILMLLCVVYPIVNSIKHETKSFERAEDL